MSMQIEHLLKPFSAMNPAEQLELIRKVRHNRFIVRPTMAQTKAAVVEKKTVAKKASAKKSIVADYLKSLSPQERDNILGTILANTQGD